MRSHGLSPPRRRALGLALGVGIVVAAIIVVVLAFGGSDHGSGNARGPVTITVDLAHRGPEIPRSFLGLSIEYQSVRPYFGTGARPNLAFLRRVAALGRAQRSPVALRIGGNSSDESWWNPTHRPRPHGVLFDIGPDWAASLARGQAQLGAPLALGLNLALNDPGNGLALVRAVRSRLKRPGLVALEIGNEPDLFVRARTFRVGRLVVHRPRQRLRYGPMRYMVEARRYIAAVSAGLDPAAPRLAIGGFATPAFLRALPALVDPPNSRVGELMAHSYPLTTCNPAVPAGDLRARLLTDDASRGLTDALTPYFATARRKGLPVRVSELNSAVCGGVAGVSDTFAAALWAPDTLFAMARRGVRQVDVHTWAGAYYAPLTVGRRARGHEVAHPRPLYFGLMLFALAAPAGSRLVPVRIGNAGATRAWATVDRSGVVRLLIINRSSTASRDIRVRIPGAGRLGRLTLLRAPGIGARGGVTLGGRDLASSAAARPPLGSPVSMRGGRGRFTLPAPSAALLTVRATGT
jgi:hypothetical protein